MILVTGATGQFGKLSIEFLMAKGIAADQISALVRDPEKAAELKAKDINIIVGNYDDEASLKHAFKGIDKLLLVSGTDLQHRANQHKRIIEAAKNARVSQIVYTSGEFNTVTPNSPLWALAETHLKTEEWLRESGLNYTILKNGLYMEYVPFFLGNVMETGTIYLPAGDGRISAALRSEMAEAAATVLATPGHDNKTYQLVNCEAYGYNEIARYISEASGKAITYVSPTEAEFRQALKAQGNGMPEEYIGIVLAQAEGAGEVTSNDLEYLIGRKPTSLEPFLKEVYSRKA